MTKIQNCIQIEGVVLTPDATDLLKTLQDNDNNLLAMHQLTLYKVVAYLARQIHVGECASKEDLAVQQFITELSYITESLNELRKP